MKIHREGHSILLSLALFLALVNVVVRFTVPALMTPIMVISGLVVFGVLQFFRHPRRVIKVSDNRLVYAPADGKVVVIEETFEPEYFGDMRKQVSIFMSPTNVHVNRNPVSGTVNYFRYHPGKYLVAWHPKSSTENERTTVVIDNGEDEVMLRQIAGALAKRIVNYCKEGDQVEQGSELGFIKFGSRVDLFLPLDAQIEVKLGQKVKANETVIARL